MNIILKAATAALACMTALPACASTLVIYDTSAQFGERIASSPYSSQEFERLARQGLLRRVTVPVDDQGGRNTADVDVVQPVPPPLLGTGVRVQTRNVKWRVITQRSGDQLSYEAVITEAQGFVNGISPPSQVVRNDVSLIGVANIDNEGRPAFARTYAAPAGTRLLVGYVIP